jgi:hypothetical protein
LPHPVAGYVDAQGRASFHDGGRDPNGDVAASMPWW